MIKILNFYYFFAYRIKNVRLVLTIKNLINIV